MVFQFEEQKSFFMIQTNKTGVLLEPYLYALEKEIQMCMDPISFGK